MAGSDKRTNLRKSSANNPYKKFCITGSTSWQIYRFNELRCPSVDGIKLSFFITLWTNKLDCLRLKRWRHDTQHNHQQRYAKRRFMPCVLFSFCYAECSGPGKTYLRVRRYLIWLVLCSIRLGPKHPSLFVPNSGDKKVYNVQTWRPRGICEREPKLIKLFQNVIYAFTHKLGQCVWHCHTLSPESNLFQTR